jgi:hypothetical protein
MNFRFSILLVVVSLILFSCSGGKPDYKKAKQVTEGALKSINAGEVDKVKSEYYSDDLISKSGEDLNAKFSKLKELTGNLISYTLKDSSGSSEIGEPTMVTLTYEVKYDRVTTTEKFIVSEQGSKYRITTHTVNN